MKILHVLWRPVTGGAELFTLELARLQARQHTVELHYLGAGDDSLPRIDGVRATAGGLSSGFDLGGLLRFRRYVARGGYDIVHHHHNLPAVAATFRLPTGRVVIVKHEHGAPVTQARALRERILTRLIHAGIDMYLANSSYTRDELIRQRGVPPERIRVIPCGIDLSRFAGTGHTDKLHEETGIDADHRIIGCIGRLVEDKGMDLFIEAVRLVRECMDRCEFVILGDGPLRQPLEALVRQNGIADEVHFLGFRPDIPELLRGMDMLLVTSVREAQGIVAIEAMAAGVPVIAFAVGGLTAVVDGAGRLVAPGDVAAMAAAACEMLKNRSSYDDTVAAGRARAREFDLSAVADRITAVYRELSHK